MESESLLSWTPPAPLSGIFDKLADSKLYLHIPIHAIGGRYSISAASLVESSLPEFKSAASETQSAAPEFKSAEAEVESAQAEIESGTPELKSVEAEVKSGAPELKSAEADYDARPA